MTILFCIVLLKYIAATSRTHNKSAWSPVGLLAAADHLIVIESDEEEEEPPKEEQPRKRTKREVGDQFDMVDLTDDDVSAHEAVKRQRRMYVADDGTYAEVLAVD